MGWVRQNLMSADKVERCVRVNIYISKICYDKITFGEEPFNSREAMQWSELVIEPQK